MEDEARISPVASQTEVRQVMGEPTRIVRENGGEEWFYGESRLKFEDGHLVYWLPTDRLIPVFMGELKPEAEPITIGATTNIVLDAMGTPSGFTKLDLLKQEIWFYGFSSILIVKGKVVSWNDAWNLKVLPKINQEAALATVEPVKPVEPKEIQQTNPATARVVAQTAPQRPRAVQVFSPPVYPPPTYAPVPKSAGNKSVYVRGYTRRDGTYVSPHYRRASRR